jgi:polyisoprenoid-binding protein YceI
MGLMLKSIFLLIFSFAIFANTKIIIKNEHSRIDFSTSYLNQLKVRGYFSEFRGGGLLNEEKNEISNFKLYIKTKSLNTRNRMRDQHLRKSDFLFAKKYPEIIFEINSPMLLQSNEVEGLLTIRDIKQKVRAHIEFLGNIKDPWKNQNLLFKFNTKINRKDFNLNWNYLIEKGTLVGDILDIEGELQIQKHRDQTPWSKHYIPLSAQTIKKPLQVLKKEKIKKNNIKTERVNEPHNTEEEDDKGLDLFLYMIIGLYGFVGSIIGSYAIKIYGKKSLPSIPNYILDLIMILYIIVFSWAYYILLENNILN